MWRGAAAFARGSITDGCSATATSSLDRKTPAQTSIADPFDVTRTDTAQWNARSAGVLANWRGSLGVDIGGFQVMIWSASSATEDLPKSLSGSADVASYLGDIEGGTGITLAGIYHVYGHLDADQRVCDMSAYVRVQSEGPFTGTLNMALWIALWMALWIALWIALGALGALGLIVVIMAGVVRHSIARSARAAVGTAAPEATPDRVRSRSVLGSPLSGPMAVIRSGPTPRVARARSGTRPRARRRNRPARRAA